MQTETIARLDPAAEDPSQAKEALGLADPTKSGAARCRAPEFGTFRLAHRPTQLYKLLLRCG
jgi:hypothetical protein